MAGADLSNPILNTPFGHADRHFVLGPKPATGEIAPGRRPSESFIPIATSRKGRSQAVVQDALDFDVTGERHEEETR